MTKVKICGITTPQDAIAAADARADFIGLVLSPSPRRVDITKVESIVSAVAGKAGVVGVFASVADLLLYERESHVQFDYYQVYFDYHDIPVRKPNRGWIRSFWVTDPVGLHPVTDAAMLLCDFKGAGVESIQKLFASLPELVQRQTFIAGNLTVDTVGSIVKDIRPFGVDVARGTELSPGVKDIDKMERFIQRVKNA